MFRPDDILANAKWIEDPDVYKFIAYGPYDDGDCLVEYGGKCGNKWRIAADSAYFWFADGRHILTEVWREEMYTIGINRYD